MVAVLFARSDSVYRENPACSVWDIIRDARCYLGSGPVIAHPPCRGWGKLRHMAKIAPGEKELARDAVWQVRRCGGVLEHPEQSQLWREMDLPQPGRGRDAFGGWSMAIDQLEFGHRARKRTWLYIVGVDPRDLPPWSITMRQPETTVENMGRREREATPRPFADWLFKIAAAATSPAAAKHP